MATYVYGAAVYIVTSKVWHVNRMDTIDFPAWKNEVGTSLLHLKKGTIIKRDFGLGIGYPSIVKYLEAI